MKKSDIPSLHGLDVRTLRLYEAVAATGNLTQAAKANHLAIGAASRRIKNFETMIGKPLLERSSRGLSLTPAGQLIAEHVAKILEPLNALGIASMVLRRGIKGHVRVLSNGAAITAHLPSTLSRFRKKHPSVLVDVEEVLSRNTAQALMQKRANIGILVDTAPTLGLAHFPYRNERMLLVAPAGHPLERHTRIRFEDTLDHEYIGLTPSSSIYALLGEQARSVGKTIRIHAQVGGLDNACRMVASGLGLTVAPEGLARSLKSALNLKLIELDGDQYVFNQIVVHHNESVLTDMERHMLEHLRADREPARPSRRAKA
jgi:DNA-binding transcriptional LysR family regulator